MATELGEALLQQLLRECVCCTEKDHELMYLLPCLHATCAKCVDDIVSDATSRQRKAAGCSVCGEPFVKSALTPIAASGKSESCGECVTATPAVSRCEQCDEFLCQLHADGHGVAKKTHTHVLTPLAAAVADVVYCVSHASTVAAGFCATCKELSCSQCLVKEHGPKGHTCISVEEAVKLEASDVHKAVEKLAQRLPQLETEVAKLIKRRTDVEASIATLQRETKMYTLQIDDLRTAAGLVGLVQRQADLLVSAQSWSYSQVLRHKAAIASRVHDMEQGLAAYPLLGVGKPIVFDRVSNQGVTVIQDGTTVVMNANNQHRYAIANDGCGVGVRSWKVTVLAMGPNPQNLLVGVFNSSGRPASDGSYSDVNSCGFGFNHLCRYGTISAVSPSTMFAAGDQVLMTVDCNAHTLTVRNTTKGWSHTAMDLPAPNPAFYPHINMSHAGTSVKIEPA